MSEIKITFNINCNEGVVSVFELGHLDIMWNGLKITSRNRIPDQSFMIFLSLGDFIDNICKLWVVKKVNSKYMFVGDDSSFTLKFRVLTSKLLLLSCDNITMELPFKLFVTRLYSEAYEFIKAFEKRINDNDGIIADLKNSLIKLEKNIYHTS